MQQVPILLTRSARELPFRPVKAFPIIVLNGPLQNLPNWGSIAQATRLKGDQNSTRLIDHIPNDLKFRIHEVVIEGRMILELIGRTHS
jgi:hypothetical protein